MYFAGSIYLMNSPEQQHSVDTRDAGFIFNPFVAFRNWLHSRNAAVSEKREEMLGYFPRGLHCPEIGELPASLRAVLVKGGAYQQDRLASACRRVFPVTIERDKSDDIWDIIKSFTTDIQQRLLGTANADELIGDVAELLESVLPSRNEEQPDGPTWDEHLRMMYDSINSSSNQAA